MFHRPQSFKTEHVSFCVDVLVYDNNKSQNKLTPLCIIAMSGTSFSFITFITSTLIVGLSFPHSTSLPFSLCLLFYLYSLSLSLYLWSLRNNYWRVFWPRELLFRFPDVTVNFSCSGKKTRVLSEPSLRHRHAIILAMVPSYGVLS